MHPYESIIQDWPETSRDACKRVVDKYGPPVEASETRLIWHDTGPWKRQELFRDPIRHNWPMEHDDMLQSFLDYAVAPEKATELARFDGSVVFERTKGELSARCEAEEANFLAVNLAHEIVEGRKSVEEARAAYAQNMADKQTKGMGPYMRKLLFDPPKGDTRDPDTATLDADGNRIRSEEEAMLAHTQPIT